MTYLTPNHPAVEAAARAAHERAWCGENEPWSEVDDLERDEWRADEAHSLSAALPHLTADDLRDTPAVADLIAERDTYREFAFEVDGLQRALEDGELDLRHCDTRLVPTEEVMDWLGQLIKRVRSGLIHQEGDA